MPFVRLDDEAFEDDDQQNAAPTGSFDYLPAEEVAYQPRAFRAAELTGASAVAFALLKQIGLREFHVRYDGGHDEGFAHADGGRAADGTLRSIESVVDQLVTDKNVTALKGAANPDDVRQRFVSDYYASLSPMELVKRTLDELANDMAGCLLGDGYGTGEYSMYGAFTADLMTGELTDDPSAEQPPDVNFD